MQFFFSGRGWVYDIHYVCGLLLARPNLTDVFLCASANYASCIRTYAGKYYI
jgi:hypothetical protein